MLRKIIALSELLFLYSSFSEWKHTSEEKNCFEAGADLKENYAKNPQNTAPKNPQTNPPKLNK